MIGGTVGVLAASRRRNNLGARVAGVWMSSARHTQPATINLNIATSGTSNTLAAGETLIAFAFLNNADAGTKMFDNVNTNPTTAWKQILPGDLSASNTIITTWYLPSSSVSSSITGIMLSGVNTFTNANALVVYAVSGLNPFTPYVTGTYSGLNGASVASPQTISLALPSAPTASTFIMAGAANTAVISGLAVSGWNYFNTTYSTGQGAGGNWAVPYALNSGSTTANLNPATFIMNSAQFGAIGMIAGFH